MIKANAICVSTMVDTNKPSASASKRYTNEVTTNAVNDPERGNPSAYFEINSMAVKSMHESRKYGDSGAFHSIHWIGLFKFKHHVAECALVVYTYDAALDL